jgi:hypothetical protein
MSYRRPNDRLCRLSKLHCADECEYHHSQPEFRVNSVHAGSCLQLDEYLILDVHEFFDKRHSIHDYLWPGRDSDNAWPILYHHGL